MARSFSSSDAKRLLGDYSRLVKEVNRSVEEVERRKSEIEQAAYAVKNVKLKKALLDIPVEDLNKSQKGLRTSLLRNCGYTTVAHVYGASVYNLSLISGISESAAEDMLRIAREYAEQAQEGIRISISADDRSAELTALVLAVERYRRAVDFSSNIKSRASAAFPELNRYRTDLNRAANGIRWLFLSNDKKLRAEEAYVSLRTACFGAFGSELRHYIHELDLLDGMPPDYAWQCYQKEPIAFSNAIDKILPGFLDSGENGLGYGLPEDLAQQIQDECFFPDGLLVELRRYQEWGVKYALHQGKVLLGDEMGLGKTIQAIATMVSLKNTKATHFVVVCPASVIENWCREIATKSKLNVVKVHGPKRAKSLSFWLKNGGVAVTTYETTAYFELDADFRFSLLVVDEAHYVKNADALRSRNVERISKHADRMLFMTGTALENKVEEMVALIKLLRPDIARSIENLTLLPSAPRFRELVAPVYYRRKRENVLSELPELIEKEEWCALSPVEELIYEKSIRNKKIMQARQVSWCVDDVHQSSKARRLQEIVQEGREDGRKTIVFSFFLDTIEKARQVVDGPCYGPINGSVPPKRRQEIIDAFDKAPAGAVLVAQIQSGGTGLNIQSASIVVLCEPQVKPSIENQAISRAYRMGQTRNVLVYRLLCTDTIDERMLDALRKKQDVFDAFADESVAASRDNLAIDDKTMGNLIEEELKRLNAKDALEGPELKSEQVVTNDVGEDCQGDDLKRSANGSDDRGSSDYAEIDLIASSGGTSRQIRSVSVSNRAKHYPQPRGGLLKPGSFEKMQFGGGMEDLNPQENVHPSLVGLAVDYLTRFQTGSSAEEAFAISRKGAMAVNEDLLFESLLSDVKGLDDVSIESAICLSGFDVAYRAGARSYKSVENIGPDQATIDNVRAMVRRSCGFLGLFGPKVLDGLTFEGGYTDVVGSGDGDFLTVDTLWDFKVSKNAPTIQQTLQIMMYWRMGLHSTHVEYQDVKYIGIYNPRQNCAYRLPVDSIPKAIVDEVDEKVIGYKK